jgi:hypothetical protein
VARDIAVSGFERIARIVLQRKSNRTVQPRGNVQYAATAACGTAAVLHLTTVRLGPKEYDVGL